MNVRTSKPSYDGRRTGSAHSVKAGIAIALAACALALAGCGEGGPAVINEAVAADAATAQVQYLPTLFPAPEGAPEPHVEAF
jgi:predicted small lipoprotein YifL